MTDYAVVVMAGLAREGAVPCGHVQTAPGLATATGIAEPTVAKVLKALGQAGLVESERGARGYRLTRPLSQVPLPEVIVAMDGPIALTACVDGGIGGGCEAESHCAMRGRWDPVNAAIRQALAAVSLADLAGPVARPVPTIAAAE
jgi:Rrf2 family protein